MWPVVWPNHMCVCMCITHNGMVLCDKEQFGEGSVKRQQYSDAGGILAQAVFHWHEELPQRSQQLQLTHSVGKTTSWKLNFIHLLYIRGATARSKQIKTHISISVLSYEWPIQIKYYNVVFTTGCNFLLSCTNGFQTTHKILLMRPHLKLKFKLRSETDESEQSTWVLNTNIILHIKFGYLWNSSPQVFNCTLFNLSISLFIYIS